MAPLRLRSSLCSCASRSSVGSTLHRVPTFQSRQQVQENPKATGGERRNQGFGLSTSVFPPCLAVLSPAGHRADQELGKIVLEFFLTQDSTCDERNFLVKRLEKSGSCLSVRRHPILGKDSALVSLERQVSSHLYHLPDMVPMPWAFVRSQGGTNSGHEDTFPQNTVKGLAPSCGARSHWK